jgi:hypothetical protein
MRLAAVLSGGTGCDVPGGVSVSFRGIAGSFLIVTACGNVAPKSGFCVLR